MGSSRNRTAGHRFELFIAELLRPIFPNVLTSRNESRTKDAQKIDLCNTGDWQIQCKLTTNAPSVDILDQMPKGKNVIIWGKVEKANVNFIHKETYVIMKLETFLPLI